MKRITLLLLLISTGKSFSQTPVDNTSVNNVYKEMEAMKKAYYQGLRDEQKLAVDNTNKARTSERTNKLAKIKTETTKRINSTKNNRELSKQKRLATLEEKKKNLIKENNSKLNSRVIDKSEKISLKKDALVTNNTEKQTTRKQTVENQKKQNISNQQSKLNKRKQQLLNRYAKYAKKK